MTTSKLKIIDSQGKITLFIYKFLAKNLIKNSRAM